MSVPRTWILCLLSFLTSFIIEYVLSASCDEALLGVKELPDSAFTATSNSETVEQSIAGVGPGVDHSAKTARLVTQADFILWTLLRVLSSRGVSLPHLSD